MSVQWFFMRILIITQKVDATDSNLGFFIEWIKKFAEHAEVTVIANEVHFDAFGYTEKYATIHSLGKRENESRAERFMRVLRYQKLLLSTLSKIDGVFFHMCPEYVLAAHFLPRFYGKKSVLWYVHKQVSFRLRMASWFVDRIFTASRESCRLRSKKVTVTGHGIDTENSSRPEWARPSGLRLITVGRISPVKDLRTLILGFLEFQKRFPQADLSVVGDPVTNKDRQYSATLQKEFASRVGFIEGVHPAVLPALLWTQTAFLHASRTGSMDKAVLEALAAGLPVFTSSEAFSESMGVIKYHQEDPADFAEKISRAFLRKELVVNEKGKAHVREHHSLHRLIQKILAFYAEK